MEKEKAVKKSDKKAEKPVLKPKAEKPEAKAKKIVTEVKAFARFIPGSAKKARLVVNQLRGQNAQQALDLLAFSPKTAALPIAKLIKSALANAEHNFQLKTQDMYIKKFTANSGPILRRWMPKAHGRATVLRKQTTHYELILGVKEKIEAKAGKTPAKAAAEAGKAKAAKKKTEK